MAQQLVSSIPVPGQESLAKTLLPTPFRDSTMLMVQPTMILDSRINEPSSLLFEEDNILPRSGWGQRNIKSDGGKTGATQGREFIPSQETSYSEPSGNGGFFLGEVASTSPEGYYDSNIQDEYLENRAHDIVSPPPLDLQHCPTSPNDHLYDRLYGGLRHQQLHQGQELGMQEDRRDRERLVEREEKYLCYDPFEREETYLCYDPHLDFSKIATASDISAIFDL
jgi:hypothetical protein